MTIPEGYCDWCVGDKIVCIDDALRAGWEGYGSEIRPKAGCVYTIREFVAAPGAIQILLIEIANRPRSYWDGIHEASFALWRFRRVQPSKKSIEQLRALTLKPDPALIEPVREVAS
jgi:hypothetical protein